MNEEEEFTFIDSVCEPRPCRLLGRLTIMAMPHCENLFCWCGLFFIGRGRFSLLFPLLCTSCLLLVFVQHDPASPLLTRHALKLIGSNTCFFFSLNIQKIVRSGTHTLAMSCTHSRTSTLSEDATFRETGAALSREAWRRSSESLT